MTTIAATMPTTAATTGDGTSISAIAATAAAPRTPRPTRWSQWQQRGSECAHGGDDPQRHSRLHSGHSGHGSHPILAARRRCWMVDGPRAVEDVAHREELFEDRIACPGACTGGQPDRDPAHGGEPDPVLGGGSRCCRPVEVAQPVAGLVVLELGEVGAGSDAAPRKVESDDGVRACRFEDLVESWRSGQHRQHGATIDRALPVRDDASRGALT